MFCICVFLLQACFASLVSQDYVNGTDQEEIRTGKTVYTRLLIIIIIIIFTVSHDPD